MDHSVSVSMQQWPMVKVETTDDVLCCYEGTVFLIIIALVFISFSGKICCLLRMLVVKADFPFEELLAFPGK